ncbi:hypothetical protein [Boudabousia marimammalium]|uniref:hypothetical protein n=1 Tax=Boudabousia marimammalium TaxID=156892 RepID=UPI0013018DD9|nr:hypothetical protein [Boudabousia marimammalium]
MASNTANPRFSELKEGVSKLTASTDKQYSEEVDGSGVFTNYLVAALEGGASDLL